MGCFIHADAHTCLVIRCQSIVTLDQVQPRFLSKIIVNDVHTGGVTPDTAVRIAHYFGGDDSCDDNDTLQ
jgi:hypothetical protein